jgi:hypothetical protein
MNEPADNSDKGTLRPGLSFLLGLALVAGLAAIATLGPPIWRDIKLRSMQPVDAADGTQLLRSAVTHAREARARLPGSPTFFTGTESEFGCGLVPDSMRAGDWYLLDVIDEHNGNVSIWAVGMDKNVMTLRADFAWGGGEPVIVEANRSPAHGR